MGVVCKIYLDRGAYRSAAGEFTYKCIPTVKKQKKKGRKKMIEIVKIVGIKKTLKKDTTDVFYWNIFYEQAFSEYDTESAVEIYGKQTGMEFAREDFGIHVGDEVEFLYSKGFQGKAVLTGVKIVKAAPASKTKDDHSDYPPFK